MSRPLLEFGGGSGEILRDLLHLRSVSEAEALISGAEGRDIVWALTPCRLATSGTGRRCAHSFVSVPAGAADI